MVSEESNKEDESAGSAENAITVKVPKSVVYIVVAILVLTAVYVLGSTVKERVTDPALDQVAAAATQVAEAGIAKAAADKAEAMWTAEGAISPGVQVADVRRATPEEAAYAMSSLKASPTAQESMDLAAIESGELKCYAVVVELESVDGITSSSKWVQIYVTEDDESGLRQIGGALEASAR